MEEPAGGVKSRRFFWERNKIPMLYPALQKGVRLKAGPGGNIRSFLCDRLRLDPDYVKSRIQTVFLNGKPVDDFDSAPIAIGATLTLSGALPGLAGATLRKGGFYRSLRDSVSYSSAAPRKEEDQEGFITLRVFNILLGELAPILAARGIFLPRQDFEELTKDMKRNEGAPPLPPAPEENRPEDECEWIELRLAD